MIGIAIAQNLVYFARLTGVTNYTPPKFGRASSDQASFKFIVQFRVLTGRTCSLLLREDGSLNSYYFNEIALILRGKKFLRRLLSCGVIPFGLHCHWKRNSNDKNRINSFVRECITKPCQKCILIYS